MSYNNNRSYFAVDAVTIGPFCTGSGLYAHGVQTATTNTSYNLEQVFELGQLGLYALVENVPNVEMTIEKVLDGYPLLYHLCTRGAPSPTLAGRSNQRADVFFTLFADSQDNASGVPQTQMYCSGMYLNSVAYKIPIQGNATETVSLVGNDKLWINSTSQIWSHGSGFAFYGQQSGGDVPASGVQRRYNVSMGAAGPTVSVFPTNLPGITVTTGSGYNVQTAGVFGAHLQDIDISVNFNREDLFELGRRRPYYRYAKFPVPVNCTINITAGGLTPGDEQNADGDSLNNTTNQPIVIKLNDTTVIDLGNQNRLQSVSMQGGGVDGSVLTMAYAYENFNIMNVSSASDPG